MPATLERELKLKPSSFLLAHLDQRIDAYQVSPAAYHRLHTVYYDTADLRLVRWGASLRFRVNEGWTLKLPEPRQTQNSYRTEHVFPGPPETVPPAALDLAAAMLRGRPVVPVAELRTLRLSRDVTDADRKIAEIVEDDVHIVRASHVIDRFRQIEIELAAETPDEVLDQLAHALRRCGAGKPDPTPKVVLAVGDAARKREVAAPRIDGRSSVGDLVRAALAQGVDRLVRIDPRLRLAPDADAVHDARVTVRRLRSHLRTLEPFLDRTWALDLRERIRWLGDDLGAARDADVLLDSLNERARKLPDADRRNIDRAIEPLRAKRDRAYARIAELLREQRYIDVIEALVGAAQAPQLNERAKEPIVDCVADMMRPVWKKLRKRARKAGAFPADRDLHWVRMQAKHARYAAELLVETCGAPAERFARHFAKLQAQLGQQHDAVSACAELRRHTDTPERAFLLGELTALEAQTAAAGREAWRACRKAAVRNDLRFW